MTFPEPAGRHNPFATRFTRPGSLAFHFANDTTPVELVERLASTGWTGQILGPHGSGKSTLCHTLLPALESAGRQVQWVQPRPEQRSVSGLDPAGWSRSTVVLIDGYEQLPRWRRRWWLRYHVRRRQAGLLITSHHDVGLPTLWHVQPNLEVAREVVARVLAPHRVVTERPEFSGAELDERLRQLFETHHGNIREMLFSLYDDFQLGRQAK